LQKTKEERAKRIAEGCASGKVEWLDWYGRKETAETRGDPVDERKPGGEEALRRKREALERSFMYRLERHWVWPHIMILALVCLVIDAVALGFGIVWLVKYVVGIEGSGTVFKITMGSLLGGRSVLASLQDLQVVLPVEGDGHTRNQAALRNIREMRHRIEFRA